MNLPERRDVSALIGVSSPHPLIAAGTRLGPYEILAPLGSGGMGEVYRARDTRLGREVALKILPERLARDREALARFRQEASSASALNHPHIVTIHDVGSDGEVHYFTMELIEGNTLRERIGRDPLKKLLGYLTQVADGLAKAHGAGILHRDLKPENIMISADGYAKVVDFGLAKAEQHPLRDVDSEAPTQLPQTSPGTVVGTVNYMSPEQVEGRRLDGRSDVFSVGCILHEIASGKRAFDARSKVDTMHSILHAEPARIADVNAAAPADLQRIVDRCLAKDPDDRYQSVKEVGIELRALLRQLDSSGSMPRAQRQSARRWPLMAILAAVVVAAAVIVAYFVRNPRAQVRSLAILPFVNGSHDVETEYLSDGITDEIINSLSPLPGLRVLARSSVFRFKGRQVDPRSLGKELGVEAVVLGELRHLPEFVNVKVELVRTSDGSQLWGRQYNRKSADLLSLQEDISRDITEHLRLRLSGDAARRIARPHTQNPQAYQAYLKGLYFWNQRPGGSAKALEYFQEAVRLDPSDALAHAGVAQAYDTMGAWEVGQLEPDFAFPRAKAAAQQALALDPELSEAYAALGIAQLHYDRDFEKAEASLRKAISLKPTYGTAHHWYSHLLIAAGRFDESLRESLKALELEPLDPVIPAHLSYHYIYAHQPDQALEQCRKTLEIFPHSFFAHYFRGLAFQEKAALKDAIAAFRIAHDITPTATFGNAAMANALARDGQRAEALAILRQLESEQTQYISPFDRAVVHIGLGNRDAAFRELNEAVQQSSSWCVYFNSDPRLDSLRDDPRFNSLLARLRR